MNFRLRSPHWFVLTWLAATVASHAQPVHWTTNFYSVTGSNFREIRQSIERSRPWKDSFDGDTRWTVGWNFNLTQTPAGCSFTSFRTTTTIVTTMPRWTPPPDIAPEVKGQWTRYFTNLLQHEVGHARIGMAAAAEVDKQIRQMTSTSDCETLRRAINERAERIVEEHRARDREYDRQTNHGRQTNDPPWRTRRDQPFPPPQR